MAFIEPGAVPLVVCSKEPYRETKSWLSLWEATGRPVTRLSPTTQVLAPVPSTHTKGAQQVAQHPRPLCDLGLTPRTKKNGAALVALHLTRIVPEGRVDYRRRQLQ